MSFMFPLGLLGLLGIPVIIIIYILQSKYREQTVNSNYLWHLSDKFLKRKNPLSGVTGLISLILQILMVIAVSLALSRPIITLPGAANEYCFILDASGSMSTYEGDKTRFERAQDEIAGVIDSSSDGSTYSLVVISDDRINVYDSLSDKGSAKDLLYQTSVSHTKGEKDDLLACAQEIFDENTSRLVYLITDKGYKTHNNIELIFVEFVVLKDFYLKK